jgi:Tripartite tricarboxylate transporter TctB family
VTSAPTGASTPGSPGGRPAAGATPAGEERPQPASGELDLQEALHQVELDEAEARPPAAGWLSNLVTALAVVALGGAALIGSGSLGLGSARTPDSGTWPMLISVVLVALGLALVALCRRTSDAETFSRASWLVLAGLATMLVFVAVIATIGFEIPAALLAFVWLRFLGHESWRTSILTSLSIVLAFYLIFVGALQVPIPHLF